MARRTLNRRELRAAAEAAEAMGISNEPESRKVPRAPSTPSLRPKPAATPRMRVVWAVCDVGGRTVATFDYPWQGGRLVAQEWEIWPTAEDTNKGASLPVYSDVIPLVWD